ncbi:LysR substrate-binding domain-containing protein [Achromobacter denitrificans]|uniref:LysR substrate-binding domain-containing protein n=1 Tax=Achromobacter denitrificans TaxID=32002 RepID=A0A6N0JX15_ACHDE|nr:hypothetical protein FOC81_01275 [Achromobacter denitrificans]
MRWSCAAGSRRREFAGARRGSWRPGVAALRRRAWRRGRSASRPRARRSSPAAGQGLALVPQEYAREEIAAGRLALALDKPWPARFAYYVVMLPESGQRPEVAAFVAWLHDEARGAASAQAPVQ